MEDDQNDPASSGIKRITDFWYDNP
jgi:hypothetical protein